MPITFVAAGTVALNDAAATTLNVPYPAGIQAGDVIAMPLGVNSATLPTIPSGWLAGGVSSTSGGSAPSERIILKVCTGTETGSVAVTTPSATSRAQMLLFRGVDNTTPLDNAGSVTASATATSSYSLPSMTTTTAGAAIVLVGVANAPGGTWTSPTSPGAFIETAETTGAIPSMGVQYLIWSGSGATGTVTYSRSTSVRGCTGMLALRPATTSTSYPADGTAAVTSAATGIAAAVLLAAGAAAAVSGSTGDADRVPQVYTASGSASVVSTSTGAATSLLGSSGSAPATSTATGTSTALLTAAGTAAATSGSTGSAISRLPAIGSAAVVSGSSGSAAVIGGAQTYPASGTAAIVSTVTGSATVRYAATGSAGVTSATTGNAAARLKATGSTTATTTATGSTTALYIVGASAPLVSGSNGDTTALFAAVGSADVVSGSNGTATGGEHVAPIEVTVGALLPARFAASPPLPHPLTVAAPTVSVTAATPLPPRYRRTDAALRR